MGMNILGLNARKTILIKPNTASQTYRINQANVRIIQCNVYVIVRNGR